ncbi:arsenate reductase (glutaredoxin) [Pseudomonas asuensis]|uniref:Arsenate reductase n=1 Tax=Pseudomonas asuensis TaxID=1825787 RepID=A0ABQ2GQ77_9PSED|nr:arsenate reductase (glutaredoxin) [Pseudomonas asuensis]GGM05571.1 arsenate reductase [Pseudomonas asuensis]
MSESILFHNPRCSKSRSALELLQEKKLDLHVVRYLETPPTPTELKDILRKLNIPTRQLLRTGEEEYKALGLADEGLSEERLIEAMTTHPKLIERPILIVGDKAVIGRPPEKVLEILP